MLTFPLPDAVNGAQLAAEIAAAGYADATVIADDGQLVISSSSFANPMPSEEERTQAQQAALDACIADARERADAANAPAAKEIAAVIAAHKPAPPAEATPAEKLAAAGLTREDLLAILNDGAPGDPGMPAASVPAPAPE